MDFGLHMPLASLVTTFNNSNLPGKIIVAILFLGSIIVWTIMVTKSVDLRRSRAVSLRFLSAYRRHPDPLRVFLSRQRFEASPLYAIYRKACLQLRDEPEEPIELFADEAEAGLASALSMRRIDILRKTADRAAADELMVMEQKMDTLATAPTVAPFLGLLGTVWGVMDSFAGMAQSSTISAVAPGVSGALFTTLVGLVVALPSAIGYNRLAFAIRRASIDMENFVQEFTSDLESCRLGDDEPPEA